MLEEIEKNIKKRKRQRILKKWKLYIEIGLIILFPIAVLIVLHILKKKVKKKVKQAVRAKVHENINRRKETEKEDIENNDQI